MFVISQVEEWRELVGLFIMITIVIVVLIVVISVDDIQVTQRLSAMYTSDSACDCYLPRSPYRLNGICCEAEVQSRTHRSGFVSA